MLVELAERPGARSAPRRGRLGLFHFAILLPDRPSLGRFLVHVETSGIPFGAADHLVSESLYLQDPDNLGIEIYADRPGSTWHRVGRELMMATDPLDAAGVVAAAGETRWTGMPVGTTMGHVHLHVGDLAGAAEFYSEILGFDRTVWEYPGALFLSAGGYHHHLGTNTWAGSAATAPTEDEAQLLEWTVELPAPSDVDDVAERLIRHGYAAERAGDGTVMAHDPWGTPLRLRSR
ncbi:MAG: VOC family protein [Gemmatimonadales bacterium]